MDLDHKDELLLLALQRNARASVVDLARRIGLSRSATQERLGRLEREGVIAGYTVRLGARNNSSRLRAWLMITHSKQGSCAKSVPILRMIPQVRSAFSIAGETDLLAEVDAASIAELDRTRVRIAEIPGVASIATHIVLTTHFESREGDVAEGDVLPTAVEVLIPSRSGRA